MTTILDLLDAIRTHLAECEVPTPATVELAGLRPEIAMQLGGRDPARLAAGLLAWADTLTDPSADAWRTPDGDRVHLSVRGQLGQGSPVHLYGAVAHHPRGIGGHLDPGDRQPVSLPALRHLADLADLGEVPGR